MVDSVPPDKSCEVFDGELNHEQWDENDSKNFGDRDDVLILLKRGHNITSLLPSKCFHFISLKNYLCWEEATKKN